MKKLIYFLILFLIVTLSTYGQPLQNCDSIKNRHFPLYPTNLPKLINCYDNFGQKQGWWISNIVYLDSLEKQVLNYSFGQYKDNKKIDEWLYIRKEDCVINLYKREKYFQDGSVTVTTHGQRTITHYNSDSSYIKSTITDFYPINIECKMDNISKARNCIIKYKDNTLSKFSFDNFEFEIWKAEIGVYDKQIRKINNRNR